METIRNYLESMFKNLPRSEKVLKAKAELGQMMEDKYSELIDEGKSENEAIGIVISEFGNLEELSAELGIEDLFQEKQTINRRMLTLDEVKDYLESAKRNAFKVAAGVGLCICCSTGPIFTSAINAKDIYGVFALFLILALGVSLIILGHTEKEEWNFINGEACAIDATSTDYIKGKRREFSTTYSIMMSVGVLLCVICAAPSIIFDDSKFHFFEKMSGGFVLWFIAVGVFLLVSSNKIKKSFEKLLGINAAEPNVFEKSYNPAPKQEQKTTYKNKTFKTIMEVYWPTVTSIYLCSSFLTYNWHITWVIWPVAAIAHTIIKNYAYMSEEEGEN